MSQTAVVPRDRTSKISSWEKRTNALAPTETPQRDYRFRTSVPFATLAAEIAAQAAAIDYPNFKSEVAARQGHDRAHWYGRIWSGMHESNRTGRHGPASGRTLCV